jgi:hypothetical protein
MLIYDGLKKYTALTKLNPPALGSCWGHGQFQYETYRMQAIKLLDRWIFEEYATPIRDLAIYRIVYASIALISVPPIGVWLVDVPAAFFSPPLSLAAFFHSFPPFWFITLLNVFLILSLSALLIGWHTRLASLSTALTWFLLNSWAYAIGKIDHDIFVVLAPAVLAFSVWGAQYTLDARAIDKSKSTSSALDAWPLSLFVLLIGLGMFTSGWSKLTTGWLDPTTHSTLGHLYRNYYVTGRTPWAAEQVLRVDSPIFWEVQDWLATLLEVGFLFAIVRRNTFRLFCAMACVFHLAVWLVFDIGFFTNVLTYSVIVPYSQLPILNLVARKVHTSSHLTHVPPLALLCITAIPILLTTLAFHDSLVSVLHIPLSEIGLSIGAIVGVTYLFTTTWGFITTKTLTQRHPSTPKARA